MKSFLSLTEYCLTYITINNILSKLIYYLNAFYIMSLYNSNNISTLYILRKLTKEYLYYIIYIEKRIYKIIYLKKTCR